MSFSGLLGWFTSDQGLMAVLTQNWLLGIFLIAIIIFVETGVVVLPFLPGDSLLFATGAFLGLAGISPLLPIAIVTVAAVAGDTSNCAVGRSALGQWLIHKRWIKPHHLARTRTWFERYGGLTITIGRFVPIVRTVAPFLAGLSGMQTRRFLIYNVLGGILWCSLLVSAGFWWGKITWVRENLQWLTLLIVLISVLPVAVHALAERRKGKETANARVAGRR